MGWLESPRKTTPENNHHYYTCNAVHEHCIKKKSKMEGEQVHVQCNAHLE